MSSASYERRAGRRHAIERHEASHGAVEDTRSPFQRDRDRILYSSAFRRLSGITQVASPGELYLVHNRLTHTLKVAQVGRSLASRLLAGASSRRLVEKAGGLDPDVVEAACLAHDLGHPPFGHVAERELDNILVEGGAKLGVPDGYDGNAQSFRIVTHLAVRSEDFPGLNLTRATLNAILKYPWPRAQSGERHDKWGMFHSEEDDFAWRRSGPQPDDAAPTLEAELMDWADDITYAVHDVEDFFRAGLIPLDRFAADARERDRFLDYALDRVAGDARKKRMKQAFLESDIVQVGLPGPFRGSRADRASLQRATSERIGKYVSRSVSLAEDRNGHARLVIDPDLAAEVHVLKELTWYYVIESPSLVAQRVEQRALIRSLFVTFYGAATSTERKDISIFPAFFREELERNIAGEKGVKRIVADLISGMSESQAVAVHERLRSGVGGWRLGTAVAAARTKVASRQEVPPLSG